MRKGRMLTLATVVTALLALAAPAAWSVAPATHPASAPVAVDDSTPRGALKMLLSAMQSADADKLHALLVSRSPLEQRMVDAIVKRADAERRFRGAVEKAYGATGARALVNDSEAQTAAGMAQLDSAEERVEGEVAHVNAGEGSDMRLQKIDGKWRVPIAQFAASPAERDAAAAAAQQAPAATTQGANSAPATAPAGDGTAGKEKAIEDRLEDEKIALRVIDEMTDEINQGKYKTPQEAADAIRMKSMVEMMKRGGAAAPGQPQGQPSGQPPSTQPTTEPSRTS
jgi:hypothetical protein